MGDGVERMAMAGGVGGGGVSRVRMRDGADGLYGSLWSIFRRALCRCSIRGWGL